MAQNDSLEAIKKVRELMSQKSRDLTVFDITNLMEIMNRKSQNFTYEDLIELIKRQPQNFTFRELKEIIEQTVPDNSGIKTSYEADIREALADVISKPKKKKKVKSKGGFFHALGEVINSAVEKQKEEMEIRRRERIKIDEWERARKRRDCWKY